MQTSSGCGQSVRETGHMGASSGAEGRDCARCQAPMCTGACGWRADMSLSSSRQSVKRAGSSQAHVRTAGPPARARAHTRTTPAIKARSGCEPFSAWYALHSLHSRQLERRPECTRVRQTRALMQFLGNQSRKLAAFYTMSSGMSSKETRRLYLRL